MIAIDGTQILATLLGVAALLISGGSLVLTSKISSRKTNDEETQKLERRIDELEGEQILQARELEACKAAREDLQRQNFNLMSKLYGIEQEQQRRQP